MLYLEQHTSCILVYGMQLSCVCCSFIIQVLIYTHAVIHHRSSTDLINAHEHVGILQLNECVKLK